MKKLLFLIALTGLFSGEASAARLSGASVTLPVKARIINLATMPLDEALAFCDERALPCPAIRERYEAQQKQAPALQE